MTMASALLTLTLQSTLVAVAAGPLYGHSTSVVELEPSALESILSDERLWAVVYYADWCPHCIHYVPVWEAIAKDFRAEPRVSLGALNCAEYTDFCGGINVEAYPTLRAYHVPGDDKSLKKSGTDIPGGRDESSMKKWLQNCVAQLQPASKHFLPIPSSRSTHNLPRPDAAHDAGSQSGMAGAISRLVDAEVAMMYALRQGVFLRARPKETGGEPVLGEDLQQTLASWLEFLAKVFPSPQACKDLSHLAVIVRRSSPGTLSRESWFQILNAWSLDGLPPKVGMDPSPYWRHCKTYTCGLWTSFHIALASRGDNVTDDSLVLIRSFVANFFGCEECVKHFLHMFDSCSFGRCKLATDDVEGRALWLWRAHNNVTLRVAHEQNAAGVTPWPSQRDCQACWQRRGGDDAAVIAYLQSSYWQPRWMAGVQRSSPISQVTFDGTGYVLVVALTFAVAACLWPPVRLRKVLARLQEKPCGSGSESPEGERTEMAFRSLP
eukprot:TRINITY_DN100295_c0_g1_i1.p1 TRINITY_DN100295_c0_g1~~TRINITY_DN100295_c0_g1_i1.p1  ORF type:complete len:493 (+),score=94.64 TRINITY_DN100295_c0_g1_i1:22-1500(+)